MRVLPGALQTIYAFATIRDTKRTSCTSQHLNLCARDGADNDVGSEGLCKLIELCALFLVVAAGQNKA